MFSLDRFSLSRFSLGVEGNAIKFEGSFSEELKSVSGVAVPKFASAFMVDVCQGSVKGTIAIPSAFSSEAGMQANVTANANILLPFSFEESARGITTGSRNERISGLWADALKADVWAGKVMPFGTDLSDRMRAAAFASKNILSSLLVSEVATTNASAGTQSTERTTVTITIPPGGELRIDSDTYRVLLDGENALYAQEGDWIKLAREVLYLDIETASGGPLEGSITYQERYL